jgi:hypothetical protein
MRNTFSAHAPPPTTHARPALAWAPFAALVAACTAPPYVVDPHEVTRRLDVPSDAAPSALEVRVGNGHVFVRGGDRLSCQIEAGVRGPTPARAAAIANGLRVADDRDGDGVRVVQVQEPAGTDVDTVRVSYELTVPPHLPLRVRSHRASIAVRGYSGDLVVHSNSGPVSVRMAGGIARVETGEAPIRLEGDFRGTSLTSDSGMVELSLQRPTSQPDVTIANRNGDVLIEIDPACQMDFSAKTRTKLVQCDVPTAWREYGTRLPERWYAFSGTLGGGGNGVAAARVRVEAEQGKVTVRCLPPSTAD